MTSCKTAAHHGTRFASPVGMQTIDVPRTGWAQQLNELSTSHQGWLVSVDVAGPSQPPQRQVWDQPLVGISADRLDDERTIDIFVARSASEHFAHVVRDVAHVCIERTDEGADAGIVIESADGTTTVVRFRRAARPESVDGIA